MHTRLALSGRQGTAGLLALLLAVAMLFVLAANASAASRSRVSASTSRASISTPPANVRARYRRCAAPYRLVYLATRIGCYRRGKSLRKPRCAQGYHHPPGRFSCERDRARTPAPASPAPTPVAPASPAPATPAPVPLNTSNPAADATQYWALGLFGANALADLGYGLCSYLNAWGVLRAGVNAPVVYAHDDHPGTGNDAAYVRYRTFLVRDDGVGLMDNAYSPLALATDAAPAAFAASQSFDYEPLFDHATVIVVRIEWWSSTAMTGAVAHRVPHYNYFVGGAGPIGVLPACAWVLPHV